MINLGAKVYFNSLGLSLERNIFTCLKLIDEQLDTSHNNIPIVILIICTGCLRNIAQGRLRNFSGVKVFYKSVTIRRKG